MDDLDKNVKYLPIGTVVMLRNGKKRVMITGFCCSDKSKPDTTYDYSGCLYPEGIITSDQNLVFNHDQIEKIYALGFADEEEKEFKERLIEVLESADV